MRTAVLLGVCALAGCDRLTPPPAHQREEIKHEQAPAKRAKAEDAVETLAVDLPSPGEILVEGDRFPAPARLVALGDVHGDLQATRRALRLAGAIDETDHWIGGELVVVQTGDQLDRGDDEQEILELLARIQHEAAAAGGVLHILNGNHEFMNALGDLRYVTAMGYADFEDAPGVDPSRPELVELMAQVPEHARARIAAFWPGQPWALELAKRNTVVVVGRSVFVHGGVLPDYATEISNINSESRAWLAGTLADPPEAITASDGPVWTRAYSDAPDSDDCAMLNVALRTLDVDRMVVGHTVHKEGVTSACEGKVWMVDVGMAAYYGGPTEVLEIEGDQVVVLRAP